MSIQPKKLKAHLGTLKTLIDQISPTTPFRQCYCLLLLTELSQRGTITTLGSPPDINNNNDDYDYDYETILETVQKTAGKALLNDTTQGILPKPIIAAAARMSALVAEKCADVVLGSDYCCTISTTTDDGGGGGILSVEACRQALTRCNEVNDDRFRVLLELASSSKVLLGSSNSTSTTEQGKRAPSSSSPGEIMKGALLTIAMGNNLRLASFVPDQPPIWKKTLDVSIQLHSVRNQITRSGSTSVSTSDSSNLEWNNGMGDAVKTTEDSNCSTTGGGGDAGDYDSYHTLDAVAPLRNLIRIARDKGNAKRGPELSLRLAESYLSRRRHHNHDTETDDSNKALKLRSKFGGTIWNDVSTAFVTPYQTDGDATSIDTRLERIRKAKTAFENSVVEGEEQIMADKDTLRKILCVRLEFQHEQAIVDSMVEIRSAAARNRAGIISTTKKSGVGSSSISSVGSGKAFLGGGSKSSASKNLAPPPQTKEAMGVQIRRDVLTSSHLGEDVDDVARDYDSTVVDGLADTLRDTLLSVTTEDTDLYCTQMHRVMCELTRMQIDRLVERARSLSLVVIGNNNGDKKLRKCKWNQDDVTNAWHAAYLFVIPLFKMYSNEENLDQDSAATILSSQRPYQCHLLQIASQAFLNIVWMRQQQESSSSVTTVPFHLLNIVTSLLSALRSMMAIGEKEANLRRQKNDGNLVKNAPDNGTIAKRASLDCALAAGRCQCLLYKIGSNDDKSSSMDTAQAIREITEEAERMAKSGSSLLSSSCTYGTSYLQFLVCWSGLHQSPWPSCTVTQARAIIHSVREMVKASESHWGRFLSSLEYEMLYLGEADNEALRSGGFARTAPTLYQKILDGVVINNFEGSVRNENHLTALIMSHCLTGISRIALSADSEFPDSSGVVIDDDDQDKAAEHTAKSSLCKLESILSSLGDEPYSFYAWRHPDSLLSSLKYHICVARQLVAELLLTGGSPMKAQEFLKQAVQDSPSDFDASFALGSFCLRMSLYGKDQHFQDSEYRKKARMQLLKAAKLNTTKADPFALLGLWYEIENDLKRAFGCYSKALLLDGDNPIAGRGILRLKPYDEVAPLCKTASNMNSLQNGWAWAAIGATKASIGDDDLAILCYQQALRCRDMANMEQEKFGVFFSLPGDECSSGSSSSSSSSSSNLECGKTWAALAGCYRRLGKYSASLRAYTSASNDSSLDLSDYCAWAQVELELGLTDEASVKFEKVLEESENSSTRYSAAYSLATCMLVIARQDVEEGKFGAALSHLEKGIEIVSRHLIGTDEETTFSCNWKLLGDLYSSASILPPSVFATAGNDKVYVDMMNLKLVFVAKGETSYLRSLAVVENKFNGSCCEKQEFSAASLCDVGTNLFLQAQIRCEGSQSQRDLPRRNKELKTTLVQSMQYFLKAIDLDEADPRPWCGLGCALCSTDPLLAQHAFCRSLQLDKSSAHAWANLGLLYAEFTRLDSSEETIDALTQVADTPIMWIGRALLLEKTLGKDDSEMEDNLRRAADAYRSALQVARHPAALLGLSCTSCRGYNLQSSHHFDSDDFGKESQVNLSLYLDVTSGSDIGANILGGVMMINSGDQLLQNEEYKLGCDIIRAGTDDIVQNCKREEQKTKEGSTTDILDSQTQSPGILIEYNSLTKETPTATMDIVKSASLSCAKIVPSTMQIAAKDRVRCNMTDYTGLSAARQSVREHPEVGENWLKLAKQLVKHLAKLQHPSKNSFRTAEVVVARAKYMLSTEMTSKSIQATKVSDALALSCHLSDFATHDRKLKRQLSADLQRALILDPDNALARAKMESIGI